MRLKFSQESVKVIDIMGNYQEARVKLSNILLNKLKPAGKSKTGLILRLNKNIAKDVELPHELFLTRRQTTNMKDTSLNNMLTDVRFSKALISKIIQSDGSFGSWSGNLGKKH